MLKEQLSVLCETATEELMNANEKIRYAEGKLTSGDVDYLDKLTHMIKSIETTMAMLEGEDGYYKKSYSGHKKKTSPEEITAEEKQELKRLLEKIKM